MALPKPTRPEYSTTIPSTGRKIRYQPFTVKEEKVLVLAAEGKDNDEIANAVRNCLKNCITSPSDVDIDELALFDIEFLFLKCRAKSVGEKVQLRVIDPSDETFVTDAEINVDKIKVIENPDHSQIIDFGDGMSLKLKYPGIDFFAEGIPLTNITDIGTTVTRCFQTLIHGDDVYNREELSDDEIREWVDGLSSNQFSLVTKFFLTMPRLSHKLTTKNTNTGKNFTIQLEGLADFF